ncbi:protein crossbronx homolog isoform X2 [Neocloeon triangulifer]|nr:protein crossbronx homolog isoform X2 [Neocloeon triangulifer]XP_059473953.1 protein crossbronx homolog isoform X2 [Neocloeon triangulifer]
MDSSFSPIEEEEPEASAEPLKRQGSVRKVLPSMPGVPDSAKLVERSNSIPGIRTTSQYGPFFTEYSLIPEYNMLQSCAIPGVYCIPAANTPLLWFGTMFVRQGPYVGGVFRFHIVIPENFPDGGFPKVEFQSRVFHPQISPEGDFNVGRGFPEWNKNMNHIWQVVEYVRKSFLKIDPGQPANEEAAKLYKLDHGKFMEAAKKCVGLSIQKVYDPTPTDDPHYFAFEPFDSKAHESLKEKILQQRSLDEDKKSPQGLSWVACNSLKPFSVPLAPNSVVRETS